MNERVKNNKLTDQDKLTFIKDEKSLKYNFKFDFCFILLFYSAAYFGSVVNYEYKEVLYYLLMGLFALELSLLVFFYVVIRNLMKKYHLFEF